MCECTNSRHDSLPQWPEWFESRDLAVHAAPFAYLSYFYAADGSGRRSARVSLTSESRLPQRLDGYWHRHCCRDGLDSPCKRQATAAVRHGLVLRARGFHCIRHILVSVRAL